MASIPSQIAILADGSFDPGVKCKEFLNKCSSKVKQLHRVVVTVHCSRNRITDIQ